MVSFFSRDRSSTPFRDHLFFLSLCLFVVSLYSPVIQVNNLSIAAIGLSWIYAGYYRNMKQLFKSPIAVGFLLFYAWQALSLLYSSNKLIGSMWLEYRSPMVYLPFFLATAKPCMMHARKLLLLFAWSSAAAALLGLLCGIAMALHTGDSGYLYNDNLGMLFDRQAVYFSMYINFGIVLFLYFLQERTIVRPLYRNLATTSVVLMILLNYLLASRVAMGVLLLTLVIYIGFLILKQKRYLTGLIILFGVFILAMIAAQVFPKTMKRLVSVTNSTYEYSNMHPVDHFNGEISKENWNSLNTRLAIWHCGKEVLKRHPLFGTGIGDVGDEMIEEYRMNGFYFGIRYNLNAHNQYLDIALEFGLIGLTAFLVLILGGSVYQALKERNVLQLYFILSLVIYLFTEVMFNRNQGITFIIFFMLILGERNKEPGLRQAEELIQPERNY
jgi:O-antigen ligase